MTNTIEFEQHVCAVMPSHCSVPYNQTLPTAISSLAASKACGLIMLVDKLLADGVGNAATTHLIHSLINRLHHNSIAIKAPLNDSTETFLSKMIETAGLFSHSQKCVWTSVDSSARLFTKAIENYQNEKIDFSSLEYSLKDFAYHFYRSRLQSLTNRT